MLSTHPWSSAWRPEQAPLELSTEFVAPLEAFLARAFVRSNPGRTPHRRSRLLRTGRRRRAPARGCHLSARIPSRTAERSRLPAVLFGRVFPARAIRRGSDLSSERDP